MHKVYSVVAENVEALDFIVDCRQNDFLVLTETAHEFMHHSALAQSEAGMICLLVTFCLILTARDNGAAVVSVNCTAVIRHIACRQQPELRLVAARTDHKATARLLPACR